MEDETLKEILGEEEENTTEYVPSEESIIADIEARLDYDDFPPYSGCTKTSNVSVSEDYDEKAFITSMTSFDLCREYFDTENMLSVTQKKGILDVLFERGIINKEEYQIEINKI